MQSHIKFHLDGVKSITLTPENPQFPFRKNFLQTVNVEQKILQSGDIFLQSLSFFLANAVVLGYSFNQQTSIRFSIPEASFLLYADYNNNSCRLYYQPPGTYQRLVEKGNNSIMLLSLRPDWIIYQGHKEQELAVFRDSVAQHGNQGMHLPSASIARNLFNSLKKTEKNLHKQTAHMESFISEAIQKYCNALRRSHLTAQYQHQRAASISDFIHKNFATEEAENLQQLANRFMVSERSLARLAKIAFGIPLHEQVIKLRIEYAARQLATTNKPIYEIALLSGYKEPHYFSKAFKKEYGCPPKFVTRPSKKGLNCQSEG